MINRNAPYSQVKPHSLLKIGDLVVINVHVSMTGESVLGLIVSTQRRRIGTSLISHRIKSHPAAPAEMFFIVMTADNMTNLRAFPRYMLRRI